MKYGSANLAVGFGAFWLILVLFLPAGLWVPDETVIYGAVEMLIRNGSLVLDNGYNVFEHKALLFNDLVKLGPQGPGVQYPSGLSFVMAPFAYVAGLKGMLAVNALAAGLSVWLTSRITLVLFDDRRVAFRAALLLGACSYLVIYAKALWPHALATACVLGLSLLVLRAIRDGAHWRRDAVLAGLVLGFGVSVRVDVVFIAPALVAVTLLWATRPLAIVGLVTLGTIPGVLVASYLNALKFGTFFPVSYGSSGGGTSLTSYIGLGIFLIGALLLLFLARNLRLGRTQGLIASAAAILVLGVVWLLPALQQVQDTVTTVLRGFATLWVDMRFLDDESHQVTRHADGTLTVLGLTKKTVVQSMPWIGILAVLLVVRGSKSARSGVFFCVLAIALWSLPFVRTVWHGGFATSMRYFLPVLPFVSILAALALSRLGRVAPIRSVGVWGGGAVLAGLGIWLAATLSTQPAPVVVQHALPLVFCGALTLLALCLPLAPLFAGLTRLGFAACIWLGFVNTYAFDLAIDISRRTANAQSELVMETLPEKSFIYALIYEPLLFQIRRGDPIAARNRFTNELDPDLVKAALGKGYVVYVQSDVLRDQLLKARPDIRAIEVFQEADLILPLYRIVPGQ